MIVETEKRDIQRSSTFEEKAMGLAKGSEAFVFNVLRKDLYSDPIGSLIREYTVNAQDEHRKYGKSDTPILIQVPNQFQPELRIRDYAGGLTEEKVFEFFGNYGASDKRNSNTAVGFFGLGCKSAFAYTDSYIVKSFKDGIEYTFNIYIDETEIGKTAKISEQPTTEPNGIEIIIPVKSIDIKTFQNKVIKTVTHFKVRPTITGLNYDPVFDDIKPVSSGDDWEFFGSGTPFVIMGEIAYPIDYYQMGNDLESWEASLLRQHIHIHVNIGDVQITASREALQMTPKTITAIRQRLLAIKDAMIKDAQEQFKKAQNRIEVVKLWQKLISSNSLYSQLLRQCGVKWKGEDISHGIIRLDGTLHCFQSYHYVSRKRVTIRSYTSTDYSFSSDKDVIYFDDTDQSARAYTGRARTLLDKNERFVVIKTKDVKALESYLKMSVKELASFNDVTPTVAPTNRTSKGTDPTKRAKHASKVFVLDVAKLLSGNYDAASEVWETKSADMTNGVYVSIDRFQPNMPKMYNLERLRTLIETANFSGIKIDIPIFGVKNGVDTTGMVDFHTWLKNKVESNTELINNFHTLKCLSHIDLIKVSTMAVEKLPEKSVAKLYVEEYKKVLALGSLYDKKYNILAHFPVDVPKKEDMAIIKLQEKFKAKYPLLKYIGYNHYDNSEILEYISEIDAKNP